MTDLFLEYDAAAELVRRRVETLLMTAPLPVRTYTAHLTKSQGKFIRARAVLACAMDREEKIHKDAVTFAAAIELLHLATLVHDDIMDEAALRRGVLTLQKKYGKRTAVICGDYLLAAAIKELTAAQENDNYRRLDAAGYVGQICMGELRQTVNSRNYNLGMFRYLSIINGKTAALFEASYYAGALTAETDEKRLRLYRRLGRYTGVTFQLTDDCIDYETDQEAAGKSVQSDYAQGVITLPVIYTFRQEPELKGQAEEGKLSTHTLLEAVKNSGGVAYTHRTARRYYEKALKAMEELGLNGRKAEILKELLDKSYYGIAGR